ncbi:hypothetical protein ACQ4M4_22800 [Leptolyngbya sp. AN02str]|uniref:DUF7734 family protein n=1 Tax=Leptolyngbya sp. AN02str TaxID=3423363 RepID=UPI003D324638
MSTHLLPIKRLEEYTIKRPNEVLLVVAELEGDREEVTVFRGFSSSLTRPTAFDPDIPILPIDSQILSIDRLKAPYNPQAPAYIQQDISWVDMEKLLEELAL